MSADDETSFRHAVRASLRDLSAQVDQIDTDALDSRMSDGVFQVDFEGGGTFVVSQQVPVRELWLSAFARAWHFRLAQEAEVWRERDSGELLEDVLSGCFTRKLGVAVRLRAPAVR
jgi:iron donor protein CyaY